MKIEQKFQTIEGEVSINRTYKRTGDVGVTVISETFVEIPTENQHLLDLVHRWASSVRPEDRLQRPPEEILALIGRSWVEILK